MRNKYLPRTDKARAIWLNNFALKFATAAAGLGFLPADVTSVSNDSAMVNYLINLVETFVTAKEQRVNYRNLILSGPLGKPAGSPPLAPNVGVAPTAVAPGVFPRIAKLVQRIKNCPAYTEAIGKDLGIIGSEQSPNADVSKPVLKLILKGGRVEVQWTKGNAHALRIEADKGTGTWQLLAIDIVPHYTDLTPITAPGVWRYRAIYMIDDKLVGQWSDVASISVANV